MTSDGYSNKVLIGNWFEDHVLQETLKSQAIDAKDLRCATSSSKVRIDYGCVSSPAHQPFRVPHQVQRPDKPPRRSTAQADAVPESR